MTTYGGPGMRLAGIRPVHRAPARLRVLHGHRRVHWWHRRLVLGAALLGAMAGALAGVGHAYLEQGAVPAVLLEAYATGAAVGAVAGLALGLALSLLLGLLDRFVLPQSVPRRSVWVRYRRTG